MQTKPPVVGFVIDNLGHGGAQKQLTLLAATLAPHAIPRVYVLSSTVEPHARALHARGVPVTTIARRSSVDVARLFPLARALAADRIDVVHGFLDAANVYAFLAARRLGKPVVLSLRNEKLIMTGVRGRALRWMLQRADAVTVNSRAGRAFLVDRLRVDSARVHWVPNIAPAPRTEATRQTTESPPVVGCVGRLVDQKRFDAVLRAFPLVRAEVPGVRLEIVGDGPNLASLRALCVQLGIDDRGVFAGAVDDASSRIARMSCLVLPSAFEGLPNTALEAMGFGVPVVASPVGDVGSIVIDGVTGVIVEDVAPAALAAAIVRALSDAALRARAREESPRLVRDRFSAPAALAVLVPLYQRLSKRTGAAALEATTPVLGE
jgi:glycosyltransferase involved in cell wall biosynthesis